MTVGRDYMLKKPGGPSAPKLFLDTKVVPAAVNILGGAEVALDRASARTGVSARVILAGAAGVGSAGLLWLLFRSGAPSAKPASELPSPADAAPPQTSDDAIIGVG